MHCHPITHHRGAPLWVALMTGPGGRGGHGPRRGRGPGGPYRGRARRGDVRAAILVLLGEGPRNGYALMQEIEERSGGAWRPSPGSVYPALQQLEDEGLIAPDETAGRKAFSLTDAGREALAGRGDAAPPWEAAAGEGAGDARELRTLVQALGAAALQVAKVGTPEQAEEARRVLDDARRALYRLLAGGDDEG